jgi:hypothetical protein
MLQQFLLRQLSGAQVVVLGLVDSVDKVVVAGYTSKWRRGLFRAYCCIANLTRLVPVKMSARLLDPPCQSSGP